VFFPRAPKRKLSTLRVAKTTKLKISVAGWTTTRRIAGKPRTATLRKVPVKRKPVRHPRKKG